MTGYSKLSLTPVFDGETPVIGAKLYFYDAGTLTPRSVYADSSLTTPYAQPLEIGASARIPQLFTSGSPYRVRIFRPDDTLLEDIDGIPGDDFASSSGGGGGGGDDGTVLPPGTIVQSFLTGPLAGWVRANGRTIGNASSGATERANADCEDLFVALWTSITTLAVTGGRGASAAADWAANKQLTLPDTQGRALVGVDAMGATSTNRLSGTTFAGGSATAIGSYGGAATVTLSTAQMPAHTHTGSTASVGDHQHSGSTAGAGTHNHGWTQYAGDHSHGGSTSSDGNHLHTGNTGTVSSDHTHSVQRASFSANVVLSFGGAFSVATGEFSTASSGISANHYHGFVTDVAGAHAHSIGTTTNGNHQHVIPDDGWHGHTFISDAAGGHLHTFTTASTGGGSAHENCQPFILVTTYLKL